MGSILLGMASESRVRHLVLGIRTSVGFLGEMTDDEVSCTA